MAIVDERGRLFGRWNLLDLALLVLVLGLIPLGYAAYLLFREQPARIVSVTPNELQQAPTVRLTIKGENLRPYMRVSAGTQQATAFHFKSTEEAEIPFSSLPAGQYDIVLFDQAQEQFRLPNALTVLPSGLPQTQIVVVGAFGNLDANRAARLTAGTELPGAGRVLAVGKAVPDVTQVFSGLKQIGVIIPNALRLPAVVLFNCYVRTQQGSPYCVVDDATMEPPALLTLSTPLGPTPFQVERVRSPHPLEAVAVSIRLNGVPAVLAQIRPGDLDLGGTANELAALARVAEVGAVRMIGLDSAQVDIRLVAQLQRVDRRWLYDSLALRAGGPITLRMSNYEVSGVVTALPPADSTPQP